MLTYTAKVVRHGRGIPTTREPVFRAYEIKTSKADFYSKHKWSFHGDYNYFILPESLAKEVEQDVPKHVGIYVYHPENPWKTRFVLYKKARKHNITLSRSQLTHDFLVSASRDARRHIANK